MHRLGERLGTKFYTPPGINEMSLEKELKLTSHIFDIIKAIFFIGLLLFIIIYAMMQGLSTSILILIILSLLMLIVCSGFLGILLYQLKDFKRVEEIV